MAASQEELRLPSRQHEAEESAEDREARLWLVTLRYAAEAADEIGREKVAAAVGISEGTLSKQLREVDGRNLHGKLLQYLAANQPSLRLMTWLVRDYAQLVAPTREHKLSPEDFAREVAAMALGGQFGRADAQAILALYERVEKKP